MEKTHDQSKGQVALRLCFTQHFFISTLIVAGYSKTATDETEEKRERFTGVGNWSVNRIRVGQALSVVEAARDKPNKPNKPEVITTPLVHVWPDGFTVEMDRQNQVKTVYGDTLNIGTVNVVSGGVSAAQTQQILGEGKEKVFRSPKSSGVISTGDVVSGKSLTYARNGAYLYLRSIEAISLPRCRCRCTTRI